MTATNITVKKPKKYLVFNFFKKFANAFVKTYRFVMPSKNQKLLRKFRKKANAIMALESQYTALTDEELKNKTTEFKEMLRSGKTLEDLIVPAFAAVRESAWRARREKHYLVQLIGGMVLHSGMIAEMGTGEGKTLVATLPAYLNALAGEGVHVITVNDYLAKRDTENMGRVYSKLGMSVGCIVHGMSDVQKQKAYASDITYGTNHEFGFDYLRDNMKTSLHELVQRPFSFCIIDEVDNILIDEARTPLIISGESVESSELCAFADHIINKLNEEDYEKDDKRLDAYFTEKGLHHLEEILRDEGVIQHNETIFDESYVLLVHHLNQSLKAVYMYKEGVQYIVKEGQVVIVDEFTGRVMDGRRYSDGLHQAIEAKENVEIQKENQTLATITYQKFFELYPKKSGMTGTAATEAEEFGQIYKLNVVVIPPNKIRQRVNLDDQIYRTFQEKLEAVVKIVSDCHERKQPVLIGTASVEKSEVFSHALRANNIPHEVLNAKNHAREASIIALAGVPGAVTIATNMAGRGTDIKLGGTLPPELYQMEEIDDQMIAKAEEALEIASKQVRESGGLFVLGTERHDSRRIDNQLRGRCGRQGDPGMSLFMVSLEDPLMKIFGGDTLSRWLPKMEYGEVIEHPLITRSLSKAQKKVEAYHFDMRKNVLRYDSIINDQSKLVYKERYDFMADEDIFDVVQNLKCLITEDLIVETDTLPSDKRAEFFADECQKHFNLAMKLEEYEKNKTCEEKRKYLNSKIDQKLQAQIQTLGEEYIERVSKDVCLSTLDMLWRQHLTHMENLRQGINLRSYGQKDPINEFKREAFGAFEDMMKNFRNTVVNCVFHHNKVDSDDIQPERPIEIDDI